MRPLLLGLTILATSCTADGPDPAACGVHDLTLETSPLVDSVVRVSWSSGVRATGLAEYALPGGAHHQRLSEGGRDHRVDLVGLKYGHTYDLVAASRCEGGAEVVSEPVQIEVPPVPRGMPRMHVKVAEVDLAQGGGWFLVTFLEEGESWVAVLDRQWDPVWAWSPGAELAAFTAELSRDGRAVLHSQSAISQNLDVGATVRVGLDGREATALCNHLGHHDFAELPDGEVAYLSLDTRLASVDGVEEWVTGDAVLETSADPDCEDDIEAFSFYDHFEPWAASPEFEDTFLGGGRDWTHSNSLLYVDEDDAYLVMSRNLDALFSVDRRTGDIRWQMGGEHSDFTFVDPGQAWSHSHLSHVWDGGMVMFDNGDGRDPQRARVVEYTWDEEAMRVEVVWEHWEPGGSHVPFLGDAKRLPGGNTLVTWGSLGRITELAPDHREIMAAEVDLGAALGRVQWFPLMPGEPEERTDPVDLPPL